MSLITRNAKEDRSMRLQTIETSSLPIDSSRPLFKHFLVYWLYISTVSSFLIYARLTRVLPWDFALKDFVFWARSQRGQLYGLFIMDLSLWLIKNKNWSEDYHYKNTSPQWVVLLRLRCSQVTLVSGYPFWQLSTQIVYNLDTSLVTPDHYKKTASQSALTINNCSYIIKICAALSGYVFFVCRIGLKIGIDFTVLIMVLNWVWFSR